MDYVERRIGPADAAIHWRNDATIPGWLAGRINLHFEGQEMPPAAAIELYGLAELARLLETHHTKARELLGDHDAILMGAGREYHLWSPENANAAWLLLNDLRLAGDRSYNRKRAFKSRVSAKQRRRAERLARGFITCKRPRPVSRVRFCSPRHVWADPRDVAACRAISGTP